MAPSAPNTLFESNKCAVCKHAVDHLVVPIGKCGRRRKRNSNSSSKLTSLANGGGKNARNKEIKEETENCGKEMDMDMGMRVAMVLEEEEGKKPAMALDERRKVDPRNYDDLLWLTAEIRSMVALGPEEKPRVGLICGSGLGALADHLEQARVLPFSQLPGFPQTNVVGHKGNLVFGRLGGHLCVCLQGRFHPYEHGMDMALCTMPVRIMALLGVRTLIVSNAAGGINPEMQIGDLMIIKDHVFLPGLAGYSPLVGLNDPRFGPRFVSLHDAYDRELRKKARALAENIGAPVKEGIYVMNGGPQYETAAECAFFARLGGDAVGMSTCHELTVARQCGIRVFGFSLITNCASLDSDKPVEICHEEVLEAARIATQTASQWMVELVTSLEEEKEMD